MAQDYSIRFTGDSSQLQKTLNDTKEKFKKISESSQSLSRKIGMIKKEMEKMALTGVNTTEEGQEMWNTLAEAARQYDEMLKKIQADTRSVGSESQSVTSSVDVPGNSGLAQNLKDIDLKGIGTDLLNKSGLGGVSNALGAIAGAVNPVTLGLTAVSGTMIAAGKATAEFETHLNSLQALTGLTDNEMKSISDGAIDMSKDFKSSAGEIVDAMKLIGSQAPELLKDSDALMEVTKAANVLSEAAEISVEDAAKAITGTMNQMGASASQATDIINTFAAASQQGSADVAYLNKAFEKSGTAASSAGMDYVQLASAIEAIAPKFSSADVAGSQLASTLLKLSMSGNQDFMPSVVGMSKALENLAKAEMDDVTMKNLVGESNITMLKSLIQAREQFDSYSESLRGTNTAFEQMEINGKGFSGAIGKMKSAWEAFLLTFGQSGIMQGITDNIIMIIDAVNEIINVVSDVIKSFEAFGESGVEVINPVRSQLDFLIDVIKAVGVAIQVVVRIIAKAFNAIVDSVREAGDYIRSKWDDVKKSLLDNQFARVIINAFNKVLDAAANMCNAIKRYWNKLKEFLGMKVETNISEKVNHSDSNVSDNVVNNTVNNATNTAEKSKKSSKSTKTKTEKIDYLVSVDDKSLDTAEKKLQAWQNKKKTLRIDDVEGLQEADIQIKKWQDEVTKRKLIVEFGNDVFDNLDKLQAELNKLENLKLKDKSIHVDVKSNLKEIENFKFQDKSLSVNIDSNLNSLNEINNQLNSIDNKTVNIDFEISSDPQKIAEIDSQIEDLKNQILIESIKIGFKPEIEKGSKTDIENEIKKLENVKEILFQTDVNPATIKKVDDEIKNLKKNLEKEEIRLGIKPEIKAGSLNEIKKKIKEKEEEINLLLNTDISLESMRKLQDELEALRKQEREKSIEIGVIKNSATISKNEESWYRGSVEDKKQSLTNAQSMVSEIQENYRLKLIGKDEVTSQLAEINSQLESLGLKPITLTFNDDGTLTTAIEDLERYKAQMDSVSDITSSVGGTFSSLGSAIGGTSGEIVNFAGQSISAIGQIIPQIVTMITAKQAEAMASGTASAASMPFPANIAAIASIIATIAGVFASLPKFESGGIVGGSSFTGDKLLARVNSGEMILNKTQQKNLYNSMNYAEIGTPQQNTLRGDVKFEISGSALKGALRNYESKMSKIK